jgi:hypothetical protein
MLVDPSGHQAICFPNGECVPINRDVLTYGAAGTTICIASGVCAVVVVAATTVIVLGGVIYLEHQVQGQPVQQDITKCPSPVVDIPRTPVGLRENPFTRPYMWPQPGPKPNPQPDPKPQTGPVPIFPPTGTQTPEPKHIFYYTELGSYAGRPTDEIRAELEYFAYIQGVRGLISQLNAMDTKVYTENDFRFYPRLMGRKFESERAIYYASSDQLQAANSTSELYDLLVRNMDILTIRFIEVKWSRGAVSREELSGVVRQAKLHPSDTFLLEATYITSGDKLYLYEN